METIGAIAIILLALACPIGMFAMGGIAWLVARARGKKKEFSASCMQHGGHEQASAQADDSRLTDQVMQLQAEVELLRAQLPDGSSTNRGAGTAGMAN